jgi:hypothetical protein
MNNKNLSWELRFNKEGKDVVMDSNPLFSSNKQHIDYLTLKISVLEKMLSMNEKSEKNNSLYFNVFFIQMERKSIGIAVEREINFLINGEGEKHMERRS